MDTYHQIVGVEPAIEKDRVGPRKRRKAKYEPSGTPMRCQIWDHRRLVAVVPVTFDDMGHPSDVYFKPKELEKVTRLAFIYGGQTYGAPLDRTGQTICNKRFHPDGKSCGRELVISPFRPLHLALAHLKLMSKFGQVVLKAGS